MNKNDCLHEEIVINTETGIPICQLCANEIDNIQDNNLMDVIKKK
jgi:hypothetical protein